MLITKTIEIDMGHRVPNHKSKCRNLHGHRYSIEVGVDDILISAPGSSSEGMVMDFGDLKEVMMSVLDKGFDHGFVMYSRDILSVIFKIIQMGNELLRKLVEWCAVLLGMDNPEFRIVHTKQNSTPLD